MGTLDKISRSLSVVLLSSLRYGTAGYADDILPVDRVLGFGREAGVSAETLQLILQNPGKDKSINGVYQILANTLQHVSQADGKNCLRQFDLIY